MMITLAKCGFAIGAIALVIFVIGAAIWNSPWVAAAALIIAILILAAKSGFWP